MYAITAITCLCREERHSTPLNEAWDKKFNAVGAMAPTPLFFKTRGGGGGLGDVAYKDRAQPRPPGEEWSLPSSFLLQCERTHPQHPKVPTRLLPPPISHIEAEVSILFLGKMGKQRAKNERLI